MGIFFYFIFLFKGRNNIPRGCNTYQNLLILINYYIRHVTLVIRVPIALDRFFIFWLWSTCSLYKLLSRIVLIIKLYHYSIIPVFFCSIHCWIKSSIFLKIPLLSIKWISVPVRYASTINNDLSTKLLHLQQRITTTSPLGVQVDCLGLKLQIAKHRLIYLEADTNQLSLIIFRRHRPQIEWPSIPMKPEFWNVPTKSSCTSLIVDLRWRTAD